MKIMCKLLGCKRKVTSRYLVLGMELEAGHCSRCFKEMNLRIPTSLKNRQAPPDTIERFRRGQ